MKSIVRRLGRSVGLLANRSLGAFGLRLVRVADGGELEVSSEVGEAPVRVTTSSIEDSIRAVRQRFPERQTVLLIDERQDKTEAHQFRKFADETTKILVCSDGVTPADVLPPLDQTAFVYACDLDGIGLPFVRHITEGGGVFFAIPSYQVARYSHIDELARQVSRSEYLRQKALGFDKFDLGDGDFLNLMQLIQATRDLPGVYLEIGCFRGSSGCAALAYMEAAGISRACHFLDVFTGFDYAEAEASADALWNGTHETEGPAVVARRLSEAAGDSADISVSVHQSNIISDPLPAPVQSIAMVSIDVDMFEAVLEALRKVAPRVVHGGVIVAEDAGHTPACIGARLALEDFLKEPAGRDFLPIYMESGQTALVKTQRQTNVS